MGMQQGSKSWKRLQSWWSWGRRDLETRRGPHQWIGVELDIGSGESFQDGIRHNDWRGISRLRSMEGNGNHSPT